MPEVEATFRRYLAGADDMLRAHAVWAALRLGRRDISKPRGMGPSRPPTTPRRWSGTSSLAGPTWCRRGQAIQEGSSAKSSPAAARHSQRAPHPAHQRLPPKVGGIQSYLWELWRRLPPDDVTVFTAAYPGADWWDRQQKFRVVRAREPVLLPQPHLAHRVRRAGRSA